MRILAFFLLLFGENPAKTDMRIWVSFSHLNPVDTGEHFSELADCKGEEEGDGQAEDVEHGETQESRFCSHYLESFTFYYSYKFEDCSAL